MLKTLEIDKFYTEKQFAKKRLFLDMTKIASKEISDYLDQDEDIENIRFKIFSELEYYLYVINTIP